MKSTFTGIKKSIKNPLGSYYLTLTVVKWIDLFSRDRYAQLIVDSLRYCIAEKGLNVYAFVIMTNHIHLVVNCEMNQDLSAIIRDFKKFTSKQLIQSIKNNPESRREWLLELFAKEATYYSKSTDYKIWQDGNYAIELYNERFTWIKIQYIHKNPIRAGYVKQPTHWVYSSASNYEEMESVLQEVCVIPAPLNFGLKF